MQLRKFTRLLNSTLIQSVRNFASYFGAKTTHCAGKISFSASTENFEKLLKNVIFGQKWNVKGIGLQTFTCT